MASFLVFSLLFGIIVIAIDAQQLMDLYLLPKEQGGQCLDGSLAGFYYSSPPSGSSNLWVIYLQGGGGCGDKRSCMERANTSKGSSTYWNTTYTPYGVNVAKNTTNPYFYQAHQVFAPYCSGDVWSGQRSKPSSDPDTWGLYFSGHLIFKRIIQYLGSNMSDASLLDAQYVFFSGGSAGAVGAYLNTNWLYNELRATATYKDNITIKAAPTAGWFYPGNSTDELLDPMMPPNDFYSWIVHEDGGPQHNNYTNVLYDAYLDPTCVSTLGPQNAWHCKSLHNLFPFIEAPIFVIENKFDKSQIDNEMNMPTDVVNNETISYVEYYGHDMDRSIFGRLLNNKNDQNGLFYPSCYDHVGNIGLTNNKVKINGYSIRDTVGDWFWEYNKLPHFVYDTCNDGSNQLPCNPTCPSYPPKNSD